MCVSAGILLVQVKSVMNTRTTKKGAVAKCMQRPLKLWIPLAPKAQMAFPGDNVVNLRENGWIMHLNSFPRGEAVERSETEEECGRQGADFGKVIDFYRVLI